MRRFNPTSLQKYIDKKDRTTPLLFTGRREELAIAHAAVDNLTGGQTQGNTVVFQGAPGAGKTSLLEHIKETLPKGCDTASLDASRMHQPDKALFRVFNQFDPKQAEKLKQSKQTTTSARLSAGIGGERASSSTTNPLVITGIDELMALRKHKNKPLVLFLDEAQNANGDLPDGKSSILQQLHEGNVGNVTLIAGGLSDTLAKFNRLGVSRLASGNTATLSPLHESEVIASLEAFLNNEDFCIDLRGCDATPLQQLVINESFGWPQHLTNTLRSLGEELIRNHGVLAQCDLEHVYEKSQARREQYYQARIETIPTALLYELTQTIPKGYGVEKTSIYKAIQCAYEKHPISTMELPAGEAYHTLIHHGVIQSDGAGNLTIPIPSMHEYIKHRSALAMEDDQDGEPPAGTYQGR